MPLTLPREVEGNTKHAVSQADRVLPGNDAAR